MVALSLPPLLTGARGRQGEEQLVEGEHENDDAAAGVAAEERRMTAVSLCVFFIALYVIHLYVILLYVIILLAASLHHHDLKRWIAAALLQIPDDVRLRFFLLPFL